MCFGFDFAGLFFCILVFRELFCQLAEIFAVFDLSDQLVRLLLIFDKDVAYCCLGRIDKFFFVGCVVCLDIGFGNVDFARKLFVHLKLAQSTAC